MGEFASKASVLDLYKKDEENKKQMYDLKAEIKVINQKINEIPELNATMHELKETMVSMNCNLSSLNEESKKTNNQLSKIEARTEEQISKIEAKNEAQSKEISNQDNKSKIDILEVLKKKWDKVIIVLYICADSISKMIKFIE